ncbi:MAG: nickel pincer cofactor biosynthesis protein LarC [Planctomycetes bacterium]|nr:nickel pincer cofactor biosynthesis protein LarC [Planctomycetota bacterium]
MRIAYFDCASGISGDMTLGALVDAGVDLQAIQAGIDSLGLPSCRLTTAEVKRHGFRGCKVSVEHEPEKAHRHLHHITEKIDASTVLSLAQRELAKRIFTRLGEAEAKVHGSTLRKVHFHEVGAVDSIADIVGAAIGITLLNVDRIVCSPIPTGSGAIEIAHGRVNVPAPATAELLTGIPLAAASVQAELTTPTGAALMATLADEFGPLPAMTIRAIGVGAGDKDFKEQANLLRLFVGETTGELAGDQIWVLETNLDDISGELIGHCTALLLEAGALDVYTAAIQMKKNRPGVTLSVLCGGDGIARLEKIIFRETKTLGIRRWPVSRHKLERRPCVVETPWGTIEGKLATLGDGSISFSPEYESCRRVAQEHNVPLKDVYETAQRAYETTQRPAS